MEHAPSLYYKKLYYKKQILFISAPIPYRSKPPPLPHVRDQAYKSKSRFPSPRCAKAFFQMLPAILQPVAKNVYYRDRCPISATRHIVSCAKASATA